MSELVNREKPLAFRISASALYVMAICAGPAHASPPLTLEATIQLPNVSGRIDHLTVDLVTKRLFVAELGNDAIDVVDLVSQKIVHRITGLNEPQGVLYLPVPNLLVVANGGDGTVRIFNGKNFDLRGTVKLGSDADNVRPGPERDQVIVGYGDGGLAIIDAAQVLKLSDIPMPGHPESFQQSASTNHVFVNVPDSKKIVEADISAHRVVTQWTATHSGNFPMAIDDEAHRIAVVFRGPPLIALIDVRSGMTISEVETCGDADDAFFDKKRHRYYVSCGVGKIDTFDLSGKGDLQRIATLTVPSGGRTCLFVPELDRLFVAIRAGVLGTNASLQVYKPE